MTMDAFSYAYSEAGIADATEKLCFMAVGDCTDEEGYSQVTPSFIGAVACCDVAAVPVHLASLQAQGHIQVVGGSFQDCLLIRVNEIARRYEAAPRVKVSSKPVPLRVRIAVYDRDGYECAYCGAETDDTSRSLDHVMPQSRGGEHTPDNLVVCCRRCNSAKRDRTPEEMGWKI